MMAIPNPLTTVALLAGDDTTQVTLTGEIVGSGGVLRDGAHAVVSNTTVNAGGLMDVASVESDGATLDTDATAESVSATINSGGEEIVVLGGIDISATINAGGLQIVGSGGLTDGAVINSGGRQLVGITDDPGGGGELPTSEFFSGGTASNTVVNGGGLETVADGGVTVFTTLIGGGSTLVANEFVEDSGSAVDTVVDQNGILFLETSGVALGTTVNGGGFELIGQGSLAIGTTVNAGGADLVFGGVSSNTLVNAGGVEVLEGPATGFVGSAAGDSLGTTLNNGGVQIVFGRAISTTIDGGTEVVWSGGVGSATVVNGKASFDFIVGVAAGGDVINDGTEFVVSGGVTVGAIVNNGGVLVVDGLNSFANGPGINSGGTAILSAGGLDFGTLVEGVQLVLAGGIAENADVRSGGEEVVAAGGAALNTSIDGGLMEVQSGGSTGMPSTPVSFTTSGGDLQLDFSQGFTSLITGFASPPGVTEEIDLQDITFSSATRETFTQNSPTSGTLTVTDGTHTANLTLLGQYSTANFSLASDGHGGTLITDPPGSATSPALAAHG
jgi:autotransporter passenger strand-loop-strand repeat protein